MIERRTLAPQRGRIELYSLLGPGSADDRVSQPQSLEANKELSRTSSQQQRLLSILCIIAQFADSFCDGQRVAYRMSRHYILYTLICHVR